VCKAQGRNELRPDVNIMNIACGIEYDGTGYHGFQRQVESHGPTIQGELEAAISRICGEMVGVTGAGRTDAGVHASEQVINFRSTSHLTPQVWVRALNAVLPQTIAVRWAKEVSERFHARFSALSRSYRYTILNAATPSPLVARYSYYYPRAVEAGLMDAACQCLLGRKDFGAFGRSPEVTNPRKPGSHSCVRTMLAARCFRQPMNGDEQKGAGVGTSEIIYCDMTADAFLTGMVRRIVGTLLLVGQKRLSLEEFAAIVQRAELRHPGPAAPPQGLCLVRVEYPEEYGV
jgi:tRNA pseudouridine38-40 synthase